MVGIGVSYRLGISSVAMTLTGVQREFMRTERLILRSGSVLQRWVQWREQPRCSDPGDRALPPSRIAEGGSTTAALAFEVLAAKAKRLPS
jgi:hypothetical protein